MGAVEQQTTRARVEGIGGDKSLRGRGQVVEDDELMMAIVLAHRAVSSPLTLLRKLISRFRLAQVSSHRCRLTLRFRRR